MDSLRKLLKKLFFPIQLLFVLIYVIFEELVWERFAEPIYRYIKYLKPFEKLESILSKSNKYVVLTVFIISLVIGEGMGVASPIVALKGYPVLAIIVYGLKLVIAAFAFWVFNTQKELLLSFAWLNYLYQKTMFAFNWVKETEIYKSVIKSAKRVKLYIKIKYTDFKNYILNRFWH